MKLSVCLCRIKATHCQKYAVKKFHPSLPLRNAGMVLVEGMILVVGEGPAQSRQLVT